MVRRETSKTAALILSAACLVCTVAHSIVGFPFSSVAITQDASILARLSYPFFHANLLHAAINVWCILSVVFIYDISLALLLISYVIAVAYPFAGDTPTVGLSGVCFALMGMIIFQVQRKRFFLMWILAYMLFGFLAPSLASLCGYKIASPDNILHLYCFIAGLVIGFLNSPVHG